ncbi:MAG: hypothetical protein JXA93_23640 [Anaerolineae bacterium]|nr:hypothetical protein [Anaerolineae bacterium]
MNIQTALRGAANESRQETRVRFAEYMAQQPTWKQAFHKWVKVLEAASLALIAGWLTLALYVSIQHTAVAGTTITAAWFSFPVSAVPLIILMGLHTAVLRASVPSLLPGKSPRFATGSRAVWSGWGIVVVALVAGAFWGTLAWAVWSFDAAMIGSYISIVGNMMGIVIGASILLGLVSGVCKQLLRPR